MMTGSNFPVAVALHVQTTVIRDLSFLKPWYLLWAIVEAGGARKNIAVSSMLKMSFGSQCLSFSWTWRQKSLPRMHRLTIPLHEGRNSSLRNAFETDAVTRWITWIFLCWCQISRQTLHLPFRSFANWWECGFPRHSKSTMRERLRFPMNGRPINIVDVNFIKAATYWKNTWSLALFAACNNLCILVRFSFSLQSFRYGRIVWCLVEGEFIFRPVGKFSVHHLGALRVFCSNSWRCSEDMATFFPVGVDIIDESNGAQYYEQQRSNRTLFWVWMYSFLYSERTAGHITEFSQCYQWQVQLIH